MTISNFFSGDNSSIGSNAIRKVLKKLKSPIVIRKVCEAQEKGRLGKVSKKVKKNLCNIFIEI